MPVTPLSVFISHATEERKLAQALADLLQSFSQGVVSAWFSSDDRPDGGLEAGLAWRAALTEKLAKADVVLAVQSPLSLGRPWIMWECALASSTSHALNADEGPLIVPMTYGLGPGDLTNPLDLYQGYAGADRSSVEELCRRFGQTAGLTLAETTLQEALGTYLSAVDLHKPRRAVDSEQMELWRGRFDELVRTGRASEVRAQRSVMYDSFGDSFEPSDPSVHELLGKVLLDQKHFADAVEEFDHALKRVGPDPHLLHQKALALTELGELHSAAELVQQLYTDYSRMRVNPEVAGLEGRIHRERWQSSHAPANLDAAVEAYTRAFDADPGAYYPGVNAASLLLAAGETDRAREAYARVLDRCRSLQQRPIVSFWTDFTAGEALVGIGRAGDAVAEYRQGLHRSPAPGPRKKETALKGFERLASCTEVDDDDANEIRILLSS